MGKCSSKERVTRNVDTDTESAPGSPTTSTSRRLTPPQTATLTTVKSREAASTFRTSVSFGGSSTRSTPAFSSTLKEHEVLKRFLADDEDSDDEQLYLAHDQANLYESAITQQAPASGLPAASALSIRTLSSTSAPTATEAAVKQSEATPPKSPIFSGDEGSDKFHDAPEELLPIPDFSKSESEYLDANAVGPAAVRPVEGYPQDDNIPSTLTALALYPVPIVIQQDSKIAGPPPARRVESLSTSPVYGQESDKGRAENWELVAEEPFPVKAPDSIHEAAAVGLSGRDLPATEDKDKHSNAPAAASNLGEVPDSRVSISLNRGQLADAPSSPVSVISEESSSFDKADSLAVRRDSLSDSSTDFEKIDKPESDSDQSQQETKVQIYPSSTSTDIGSQLREGYLDLADDSLHQTDRSAETIAPAERYRQRLSLADPSAFPVPPFQEPNLPAEKDANLKGPAGLLSKTSNFEETPSTSDSTRPVEQLLYQAFEKPHTQAPPGDLTNEPGKVKSKEISLELAEKAEPTKKVSHEVVASEVVEPAEVTQEDVESKEVVAAVEAEVVADVGEVIESSKDAAPEAAEGVDSAPAVEPEAKLEEDTVVVHAEPEEAESKGIEAPEEVVASEEASVVSAEEPSAAPSVTEAEEQVVDAVTPEEPKVEEEASSHDAAVEVEEELPVVADEEPAPVEPSVGEPTLQEEDIAAEPAEDTVVVHAEPEEVVSGMEFPVVATVSVEASIVMKVKFPVGVDGGETENSTSEAIVKPSTGIASGTTALEIMKEYFETRGNIRLSKENIGVELETAAPKSFYEAGFDDGEEKNSAYNLQRSKTFVDRSTQTEFL